MATHSSIITWKIPWTEEPGWATTHRVTQSWTWVNDSARAHRAWWCSHMRIDAFELRCWRRFSRVFWCARGPISPSWRKSVLNIHLNNWCWNWNSNTLAIWCEQLTHWKRPRCWERLKAGEEGDNRGWDGWMASLTWWTWGWASSGSSWWTGKLAILQSMGSQRVRHDWVTELTEVHIHF